MAPTPRTSAAIARPRPALAPLLSWPASVVSSVSSGDVERAAEGVLVLVAVDCDVAIAIEGDEVDGGVTEGRPIVVCRPPRGRSFGESANLALLPEHESSEARSLNQQRSTAEKFKWTSTNPLNEGASVEYSTRSDKKKVVSSLNVGKARG